ncbi:MAG TPA: hypothetical protein H9980_03485 [Candidatus Erysipelatoclostridium merdavium]|uniref:Succinate dehydrogenase n=1 Tax=Candidatus Erysipelatoclostridium merdavium TaxID=2838566 RepID=A0A9D1XL22_9FIRM|nr:hypothetical protein [Candidatus Erysipelatoclostridium merdavium]
MFFNIYLANISNYFTSSNCHFKNQWVFSFYLVLLFAVELHGGIGLYRLCVKWGWFEGKNAKASRKALKKLKWIISVFFIALGLLTMAAYIKVGMSDHEIGSRYIPTYMR